jgi:hypothetical protein
MVEYVKTGQNLVLKRGKHQNFMEKAGFVFFTGKILPRLTKFI